MQRGAASATGAGQQAGSQAKAAGQQAGAQAQSAGQQAGQQAKEAGQQAAGQAKDAGQQAAGQAKEAGQQAGQQAQDTSEIPQLAMLIYVEQCHAAFGTPADTDYEMFATVLELKLLADALQHVSFAVVSTVVSA